MVKKPKPHTHVHSFLKEGKEVLQEKKLYSRTLAPRQYMFNLKDELTKNFVIATSIETYLFDKDAAVEYVKYQATFLEGYELTIHTFSCYCEPLNEDQEPPF